MNITITPETKLGEVRDAFALQFPLLSLRFFETAVNFISGKVMEGKRIVDMQKSFRELNPEIENVTILVAPETKVKILETIFYEKTGIFLQIYRQSGQIWLQTTATDSMTLAEVEKLSLMMSEEVEKDETEDFHEQK